jgi:hypothetical protein
MFIPRILSLLLPVMATFCFSSAAQVTADQKKQENIAKLKSLVDAHQYRINAQSATTMKGRTIQLSYGYNLKINQDSLNVDLPYYGRAYNANYGSTDNGIKFKSTDFTYVADTAKKGGWEITIKPNKETRVNNIYLSITPSGYCTIRLNSTDREPISYYGTISELHPPD